MEKLWDQLMQQKRQVVPISSRLVVVIFERMSGVRKRISIRRIRGVPHERINFTDTARGIDFKERDGLWSELVEASRAGIGTALPGGFYWHQKTGRLVTSSDGEKFSLSINEVMDIQSELDEHTRQQINA